ncbi:uncharacterized protein DEA37_0004580 [Paragonimus westermani]|uniref:Archease domain-containing protein n=1 Tax=Paragonimus westermani TaxID=34504 RepID=A0A5J4NM36_9TREM|nr:uncharacterized protein DEA37_0004580 [Paragonimus westermani]
MTCYLSKPRNRLHSWGDSLAEAFEQIAMAMFGYMTTNYDTVEMLETYETEAEGHDGLSLLFHFLDEWLFAFSAEPYFIPRHVVTGSSPGHRDCYGLRLGIFAKPGAHVIIYHGLLVCCSTAVSETLLYGISFVQASVTISPSCYFSLFSLQVVKITEFDFENFRIKSVGWGEPFQLGKHPQGTEVKAITYSNMQIHERPDMHELFVIIDI